MSDQELKPLSVTQYVALMVYLFLSVFIWIPIGYLGFLINPQITILAFVMAFLINVCKMYLGVK